MSQSIGHINQKLPYRMYDKENQIFHNSNSLGFMIEITVLSGCNEQIITSLSTFIREKMPEGNDWNFSFSMIGSQYIGDLLTRNLDSCRDKNGNVSETMKFEHDFIKGHAIKGFSSKSNLPNVLRDYRSFCFCSTKSMKKKSRLISLKKDLTITLNSMNVGFEFAKPEELISYVKFIGNNDLNSLDENVTHYDSRQYISQQVLSGDTSGNQEANYFDWKFNKIGKDVAETRSVGMSLRGLPFEIGLWQMPDLFADAEKPANAIRCPFALTVNFNIRPLAQSKSRSARKLASKRKIANTKMRDWFPTIDDDVSEWQEIVKGQEKGEYKLVDMTMDMLIFSDKDNYATDSESCINTFGAKGLTLRVNEELQWLSIFNSMPFLRHEMVTASKLSAQEHCVTTVNMANMLPIVADYKGSSTRTGLMMGTFRNQISYLDNFQTEADNYNMIVSAASGSGKSVFIQALMDNHLQRGGEIYLVDKGGSSKKYANVKNAVYLQAKDININPFSYITSSEDSEYIDASNTLICNLIEVMVDPDKEIHSIQRNALLYAVTDVRKEFGNEANIDNVIDFLNKEHKQTKIEDPDSASELFKLKYSLKKYSKRENGQYANIFNGKTDLGDGNPLTILELEDFEYDNALLKTVFFALMVVISEKMYHSGKEVRKMAIFEEAWKLIGDSSPKSSNFIECGFRTARKFNGSFVVITQDLDDFYISKAAQSAWNNSGVKIIMRQDPVKFAQFIQTENGAIFNEYEIGILNSFMKAETAGFSSLMIKAGGITTFNRLFLDPYKRILLSTEPNQTAMVDKLVVEGFSMEVAVYLVADRIYGKEITQGIHQYFKSKVENEIQKLKVA